MIPDARPMLAPAAREALGRSAGAIAVTGASGWLGLATLDLLQRALGDAFQTRVRCFGSSTRTLDLGGGRLVEQQALGELASLEGRGAHVLHFAFQTKDRAETMAEDAYRAANRAIGDTVLEALGRIDPQAVFVASSGAAAKADDPAASPAMRLYGALKREDEERFADWAQTRGRRAVIGRIFNVTGPYINKHGAYAIASFILDALGRRPIAVHAPREVIRGYVAIRELMSLVIALLSDGEDGVTRFDSGGEALELGAVARIVADTLGGGVVQRAAIVDPAADRYTGNERAYALLLARYGIERVALDRQVEETAAYLATAPV